MSIQMEDHDVFYGEITAKEQKYFDKINLEQNWHTASWLKGIQICSSKG